MSRRRAGRGVVLAAILLVAGARPATALSLWTVTGAPTTMTAGNPTDVRLAVTNLVTVLPFYSIGCVTVFVPTPSAVDNLSVSSVSGSWSTSTAVVPGGRLITYHATSSGDRIGALDSGDFRSRVTATGSGTQTWQVVAYDAMTCDTGAFPAKTFDVVVNAAAPTPTPAATPTPTIAPTAAPTAAPTSAPTVAPTVNPTAGPTAGPTSPGSTAAPGPTPTPGQTASPTGSPGPAPTGVTEPGASPTPEPGASAAPSSDPTAGNPAPSAAASASAGPGASAPPAAGSGGPGDQSGGISLGSGDGPALRDGPDWLTVTGAGQTGPSGGFNLGAWTFAGLGGFVWAVPAAVLGIPGFIVIVAVLLQATGGLVWLPLIRRRIGGFRGERA